jgi:hypothetical protein
MANAMTAEVLIDTFLRFDPAFSVPFDSLDESVGNKPSDRLGLRCPVD